ncbi:MerR family transcriptional regulator [Nocardia terpenica]|uniref:MerR family transcriptional regulator n=1 Tax=Nocardia terpenica TaxID=455432 RepID=A0A291RSZ6_9NOCA|nr:MerR family transcriptional regulator [Nocardia terpenica]
MVVVSRAENSTELVAIGQAARRFGLTVPTLRYWEERGLIRASARRGGVRHYDPEQMYRIALIQLWQELGQISLDDIARMLTDRTGAWRDIIADRIRAIEEQQRRLAEGKAHLQHLLVCPSPEPAGACAFMRDVIALRMTGSKVVPRDLDPR